MTKDTPPLISQAEWRRVSWWSAFILFLASLSIIVGYLTTDNNHIFIGTVNGLDDTLSYLAKMQQGYAGSWTLHLPYTTEPHPGIFLMYLTYLSLGHLAKWVSIPVPLIYHTARILGGLLLLSTVYRFIAVVLPDPNWRWTTFLLASVANGFGWAIMAFYPAMVSNGIRPLDLWRFEFYTFGVLLSAPHIILGLICFLTVLQNVPIYWETKSPKPLLIAAGAALGTGVTLPFLLPLYSTILALSWLWERRWKTGFWHTTGATILVVGLPIPILFYYWYSLQHHPLWASFIGQNQTLSPSIWQYPLGYGLVGILAIPGIRWAWRSGPRGRLVIITVAVSLLMAYAPIQFQRRLVAGAHVPLCILAAAGVHHWLIPRWRLRHPKSQKLVRFGIVGFSALSSIYILAGMIIVGLERWPEFYPSSQVMAGARWLAAETSTEANILAALPTSRIIPAYTGRRVMWGHPMETPFMAQRQIDIPYFFSTSASDAERVSLLNRYQIDYIFYGPDEQALGEFQPQSAPYLEPIFQNDRATIYAVVKSP